jgi:hypothetical protein
LAPAVGGCAATFTIAGGSGGNAVLGRGGAGASFGISVFLPAGTRVSAVVGSAASGCAVTYCSSGGGAASALLRGPPSASTSLLAVAGGGGGSSTTVTQVGGAAGAPGGAGATGTGANYGGKGGNQTAAGNFGQTQSQYAGIGCCLANCGPGACAGAGSGSNGGRGGGAAAAVCVPGGRNAVRPTFGAGGCGWTYVPLAGGGGGGGDRANWGAKAEGEEAEA